MKKMIGSLLTSVAILGVLGVGTTAHADDVTPNPTEPNMTDNSQTGATTKALVTFGAGTLSLYNVPDAAIFSTRGIDIGDVWTNGFTTNADTPMSATVDDFLGADNDTWTLSVKKSNWEAEDNGSATGASVLDNNATLSIGGTALTTAGAAIATGGEGSTAIPEETLNLKIAKGALIKKGSYSNTLTWNLTDPATANQN